MRTGRPAEHAGEMGSGFSLVGVGGVKPLMNAKGREWGERAEARGARDNGDTWGLELYRLFTHLTGGEVVLDPRIGDIWRYPP